MQKLILIAGLFGFGKLEKLQSYNKLIVTVYFQPPAHLVSLDYHSEVSEA
jgi:hypothetical protein